MERTIERLAVSQGIAGQLSIFVIPAKVTDSNVGTLDVNFNTSHNDLIETLGSLIGLILHTQIILSTRWLRSCIMKYTNGSYGFRNCSNI